MDEAAAAIADLDSALAEAGQDVILRRIVGSGTALVNIDVKCRASVRTYRLKEEQIDAGIATAVQLVTISPTQINEAQWPGGGLPGQSVSPSIPRRNDKMIIDGRPRNVEAVEPMSVGNQIVRFNLEVVG
jgi:hypothetical protein